MYLVYDLHNNILSTVQCTIWVHKQKCVYTTVYTWNTSTVNHTIIITHQSLLFTASPKPGVSTTVSRSWTPPSFNNTWFVSTCQQPVNNQLTITVNIRGRYIDLIKYIHYHQHFQQLLENTSKLSYRKDDHAMCPIKNAWVCPRLFFPKF